ncbi:unnamed protein product [Aureobasidium vineae]|uniref:F-box domain-containing protein n=1 Tax=Aureobasidium vineae TaxID=2773715 RepID=A0A9N8P5U3_9PEZI|nr:unnamed protein product [Aureobasidium vineae]
MDTLPLELKQRVCSYLTPKDLKSLRLTSKVYAVAAGRYLLPRIFLFNHSDSFQDLQDIVNNPDLRHSVTTLIVDTSCLPLFPKYQDWARLFTEESATADQTGPLTAEAATNKNDTRAKRALRRERNKTSMLDGIALAFQKCPKLSNLVIECYGQRKESSTMAEKRERFYRDIPLATAQRSRYWYHWSWDSMYFNFWDIMKQVHNVDRALGSLGRASSFLASIVARAPKLESVGLVDSLGDNRYDGLFSLMGESVLGNLRVLSLTHLGCQENDLVRFLLRHSNTLQRLNITYRYPEWSVDWTSFATRVRGQLPNLRRVQLVNLPRSYHLQPMINFWAHPMPQIDYMVEKDILQDHEHELETGPMEIEDGLWADYEKLFFPAKTKMQKSRN